MQPIDIAEARIAEKPVVARLVQLYLHDFSEFAAVGSPFGDVDADGLFEMQSFDRYWREPGRLALLIRVGGQLAGFAFLNGWSPSGRGVDRSMAEFFVMRKYRRARVGLGAAHEILRRYPGIWEINVAHYNKPAAAFWEQVTASVPGYNVERLTGDGKRWAGPIFRLVPKAGVAGADAAS